MTKLHPKLRSGYSSLELVVALALVGALIVGALSMVSQATTTQNSGSLLEGVARVNADATTLYAAQSAYPYGSLVANLIQNRIIPTRWIQTVNGQTTLVHEFGGALTIEGQVGGRQFSVGIAALPKSACIRLLPALSADRAWESVFSGPSFAALSPVPLGTSPDDADGLCDPAGTAVLLLSHNH